MHNLKIFKIFLGLKWKEFKGIYGHIWGSVILFNILIPLILLRAVKPESIGFGNLFFFILLLEGVILCGGVLNSDFLKKKKKRKIDLFTVLWYDLTFTGGIFFFIRHVRVEYKNEIVIALFVSFLMSALIVAILLGVVFGLYSLSAVIGKFIKSNWGEAKKIYYEGKQCLK